MKYFISVLFACVFSLSSWAQNNYPTTKQVDSSDTYWGMRVTDPYRWLENLKDSSVVDWFKTQFNYTNNQLSKIPGQDVLIQEIKSLEKITAATMEPVAKAGGKYFYQKRLPDEATSKLYYRQGENGKEVLLFDPQTFRVGETVDYQPKLSDDGSRVLMIITEAGADLGDIYILDVTSKKFLLDVIPHANGRFAGGSNTDVLYLEYASKESQNTNNLLNCPFKLHVLGTPLSDDLVLASAAKYPELKLKEVERPWVSVYKTSPYIILETNSGGDVPLYYALKSELKKEKINWKPLAGFDQEIKDFFVNGTDIYLLTSKANPKFKIIKTSLVNPDLIRAEIIAEGKGDWKISTVQKTKDYLLINFSKNELVIQPRIYSFKTGITELVTTKLKGNTSLSVISAEENEVELFNTGWNVPTNRYRYDIKNKTISQGLYHITYNGNFPELNNLSYEEVEVPSHDGTLVPLTIIYNKTLFKKDGSNRCIMVGYGAYGANSLGDPSFEYNMLPLVNRGVVMALAHVRGGGEKGNDWHQSGKKTNKPNTWKDFNACTEWLIHNKYTSPKRMAGIGASAGGILIGRAITERPDLYKVVISKVGIMNALLMEFTPSGPTQIAEFGTVKDSIEFKALLEMDAYHNTIQGVQYPAQLITGSFKDFRVPAYMPGKFAAKMQASNVSTNPILLYVDYEGGHFGSSNIDEKFAQIASEWGFIFWQTGHPDFQPKQ
jgi:prolyl oligopeptidase